jgi:hypothetical protein
VPVRPASAMSAAMCGGGPGTGLPVMVLIMRQHPRWGGILDRDT